MTIKINLDDLTQDHIDRCAPHLGSCSYASPCIIGTLTGPIEGFNHHSVIQLVNSGQIVMPADQENEAEALQNAFDRDDARLLSALLAKRGLKWPVQ